MKIINGGDYDGVEYVVDQDLQVNGGSFVGAKITTNGHAITISDGDFFAASFDGELNPERWPENVKVYVPVAKVVERGNRSFKTFEMGQDVVVLGGNFTLCHVTTNGFRLDRRGGNFRGLYIDGVKQDDYVWQRMGKWAKVEEFQDILRSKKAGEGTWDAWAWTVGYCQAKPASDRATFLADYEAQDFVAYQGFILKTIGALFSIEGYEAVRDAINTQPRDRLVGEDTEVVEERS